MALSKDEKTLSKTLKDLYNINWEKYQERFNGTKPLEIWTGGRYPMRLWLGYKDREQFLSISSKYKLNRLGNNAYIELGFKKKVDPNEVKKFRYILASSMGPIFQKDIIDKILEVCPDDFEPVKVTLKNWHKNSEPFSIEGFYAINALKVIKAIDESKSEISWSDGIANIGDYNYKEDPWQDGCDVLFGPNSPNNTNRYPPKKLDKPCMIAIDALSGAIVWHPKLAKIIPPHPYLFFAQDFETRVHLYGSY
ncbi:hypothetical protein phytr_10530 [Candidatus Phycorickettsia trachydisci]|uniref:Uncharacterized protein n=1 Tax=Candidatus Phycorickettsia trachydisci TaxID=2115978 RepID=A0A2P1P9N5_9RICK|nr:hypothetical protein [Candidatus Phycorickettsia trachydisci]AVP87981.1 hypothetical protein phytr_10530 [Candidatus Phycorickettsia trachydisci]